MNRLNGFFENNLLARTIASHKYHVLGTLALVFIIKSVKKYFEGGKCASKTRLDGKTVVITGGNTGIGKETALDLAQRGARVIIACRDVKKGIRAAEEIRRTTGNGNVVVEYLDLASFDSVKRFAEHVNKTEEFVHILINNAGEKNFLNDSEFLENE
jgi:retinol dehydrogenase-12